MTKYGRRVQFGFCPIPTVADPKRSLQLAALAETLGLDYVGIQEHPAQGASYDTWTLLTALAMKTSRISLFGVGADLSLRSPMGLAKAAASLDRLTDGRVEIGLDAGMASEKFGGKESQAALEEAIQVMRLLWSGGQPVNFEGKHYQLVDLHPGPAPAHRMDIWIGANTSDDLALAGRLADGWIVNHDSSMQPDDLAKLSTILDDAAVAAGRDPSEIQRVLNISGRIGRADGNSPFHGPAKQWAEELARLAVDVGMDTFLLMEGEDAEEQLQRFALEIMPHTCKLVEQAVGEMPAFGLRRAYQGSAASGATRAEEKTGKVDLVDETLMGTFPASDPPASNSFT